jgi:hypothetical protein
MAGLTLGGVDPDDSVLRELSGAVIDEPVPKSELGRVTFLRLWGTYNFRVKTYQEPSAVTGSVFREGREEAVSNPPPRRLS